MRSLSSAAVALAIAIAPGCDGDPTSTSEPSSPAALDDIDEVNESSETPTTAAAEPSPPSEDHDEAADAERDARARAHATYLREGRRHASAGELDAAIEALRAAVGVSPNHGPTVGELGFVYLRAERLDEATALTRRALQLTDAPRRRAPLLYNLGRIAEARGELDEAREHYRESLRLRPNRVVRTRLRSLGGAADATAPIFSAHLAARRGPFPDHQAACRSILESTLHDELDWRCRWSAEPTEGAVVWGVLDVQVGLWTEVHLVIRGDEGLYLMAELGFREEDSRTEHGFVDPVRAELVQILPGGAPELVATTIAGSGYADGCGYDDTAHERALVCALSEGAPSCFASFVLGPRPYTGEGMMTVMESLGECDDGDYADPPAAADEPSYTLDFSDGSVTVGGGRGADDPRVGTFTAARAFCGLRGAPAALACD